VAAATGYLAFVTIHGTDTIISGTGSPDLSATDLVGSLVLGAVGGLVARAFAWLLRAAKQLTTSGNAVARIALAGAVLAALAVIGDAVAGEAVTIGVGYHTIEWALHPDRAAGLVLLVLVLHAFATAATVSGGGVGGLFIPLVVTGALLGRAVGNIPGFDEPLAVIIGVAAVLGAGYRVPLAAVVFVAEAAGRPGYVVPALLAAVAAELVMGRRSVTVYQRRTTPVGTTDDPPGEPPAGG
jgi:CIC family chloride channel protein